MRTINMQARPRQAPKFTRSKQASTPKYSTFRVLALWRRTGHMSNMRSEGDLRVAIREAGKRTASANETLNRRMADLDRAVAERNERFGRQAMQRDARKAAEGLNLSTWMSCSR